MRRVLVVLATLLVFPVAPASAADPITVTLEPIAPTIYRGDYERFTAHVTGYQFGVFFQQSFDGQTFDTYEGSSQSGGDPNTWLGGTQVTGSFPLGTRWVRACANGTCSDAQTQEILIHDSSITKFWAFNPDWSVITPSTPKVRLVAETTRGFANIERKVGDTWEPLFTIGNGQNQTYADTGALGEGDFTFRARVEATDYITGSSQEITLHVPKQPTTTEWISEQTVQAHHSLPSQVSVNGQYGGGGSFDAQMTVQEVGGSFSASGITGFQFTLPPMAVGSHQFHVTYAGNDDYLPSEATFAITVTPDTVEATSVALDQATFYPVVDGYLDVVHAKGSRKEPLSVTARIYDGAGHIVRTLTAARATGAYWLTWNGKSTAGVLVPAGKYRFVQTLEDAFGTRKAFTSYVTVSHKRLVNHTTTVTKTSFTVKTSSWGGWQFTLPAATIYRSLRLEVYGRSAGIPGAQFGAFDNRECEWSTGMAPGCTTSWRSIGTVKAWYGGTISPTYNRHGRYVRAFAVASYSSATIYSARIKVTYATLQ